MIKTINSNDMRRLAALIAGPLKDEGTAPEVAKFTVRTAINEFTAAYRVSYGIVITAEQKDELYSVVMDKLG